MHEEDREVHSGGSWFSGLVWGALIGAGVALLTTRRTGDENREMLTQKGQELKGKALEYRDRAVELAEEARIRAEELASETRDRAATIAEEARVRASRAVDEVRGRSGEVREIVEDAASDVKNTVTKAGEDLGDVAVETKQELRRENGIMDDMIHKNYDL